MSARPIVLVSMPWATGSRPSLSVGLLSAILRRNGFPCEVLYANLLFSCLAGPRSYEFLADTPAWFGVAEHIFATQVFGAAELGSDAYLHQVASQSGAPANISLDNLVGLRNFVPGYLSAVSEQVLSWNPSAVGFTCTFNQVMPSVALAARLKQADPSVRILLGGPCVHGEMGVTYSRVFQDYVDAVFLGEADDLLPEYLNRLSSGLPVSDIPGLAIRGSRHADAPLVARLDGLPVPDYTNYFSARRELADAGFSLPEVHSLPFEASRGCWWGQKHHCTFCGLNNTTMTYRRKSAPRVVAELQHLIEQYPVRDLMAADNILDFRAYSDLLPRLAALPHKPRLFFELKANVSRADVSKLAGAGVVWVQPGFETFSDHVLQLMKKGTSALQNIATLKWLAEFGIRTSYNLLVGFPGETDADYEEILEILPLLFHLPAPGPEASIVQVQRFAPFHFAADRLGIGPIKAAQFYSRLIPPAVANADEFAYFFDRELAPDAPVLRYLDRVNQALSDWSASAGRISLTLRDGSILVSASEAGYESTHVLSPLESAILAAADSPQPLQTVTAALAGLADPAAVEDAADSLTQRRLLLRRSSAVLTLAPFSRPTSPEQLAEWYGTLSLAHNQKE